MDLRQEVIAKWIGRPKVACLVVCLLGPARAFAGAAEVEIAGATNSSPGAISTNIRPNQEQSWNWHVQNTDIVQGYPGFASRYSGPDSLRPGGQVRETVSLDVLVGARLWQGAEAHLDGLMWQGFGVSKTLGVEAFPNGEGFRLGTSVPNVTFARLFIRQ
ncbi:MAG TPA: hypothetical protein VL793_17100, partial [Patescibacteria group bacterium]|nr:hypothetical protein [Patescibacteria group bacterium]